MIEVLQNGEGQHAQKGQGQKQYLKDPNWLRENIDNEEALLEFLDDPENNLEE